MKIAGLCAGVLLGSIGLAEAAVDVRKNGAIYEIVNDGEAAGTFWNPQTGESDVKFSAPKGADPQIFWSANHRYLAANGGTAKDRQVFLYAVDGADWTPVAPGQLSDEQLAPLNALGDWMASGTEAVRWKEDDTLLMRVWAKGRVENETRTASVWANLKVDDAKSEIVGTSTEEPMASEAVADATKGMPSIQAPPGDAEPANETENSGRLDVHRLTGEHEVVGRNPDGSEYRGKVIIRAKGGLLLFQWTIGDTVTHGTGLLEDMTVGVALESGLAIYQAYPQAEGISLIGLWKTQGAKNANEETILIGNADMTTAQIEVNPIDGEYDFRRALPDDAPMEGIVKITGGDVVKTLEFQVADGNFDGEGLALGDGLAVITSDGFSLYATALDGNDKGYFSGHFVNARGQRMVETLKPAK